MNAQANRNGISAVGDRRQAPLLGYAGVDPGGNMTVSQIEARIAGMTNAR
jgi:hypothetical protein